MKELTLKMQKDSEDENYHLIQKAQQETKRIQRELKETMENKTKKRVIFMMKNYRYKGIHRAFFAMKLNMMQSQMHDKEQVLSGKLNHNLEDKNSHEKKIKELKEELRKANLRQR